MPLHPDHRAGLEAALKSARMMVENYREQAETYPRENAALEAAGLKPRYNQVALKWAREDMANYQSQVEALEFVIDRDNQERAK